MSRKKNKPKGPVPIRFAVCLTYRCSASCKWCNRFLDVKPWVDTDMSLEALREGYNRVKAKGVLYEKVRMTGGEPLIHPQFVECMRLIQATWNKDYPGRTVVFSNGKHKLPKREGWRYRVAEAGGDLKEVGIKPFAISPADLGMSGPHGTTKGCHRRFGCGRLFDVFGFSICIFAGPIGRALGIDPYSPEPVTGGMEDICKHCVFCLGVPGAFKLFQAVQDGEIEYPTKSYREGFKRWEEGKEPKFVKFLER